LHAVFESERNEKRKLSVGRDGHLTKRERGKKGELCESPLGWGRKTKERRDGKPKSEKRSKKVVEGGVKRRGKPRLPSEGTQIAAVKKLHIRQKTDVNGVDTKNGPDTEPASIETANRRVEMDRSARGRSGRG